MIQDSGNRTKFDSGAVRDIQEGKGRCDLLPLSVIGYWLVDPIFEMIDLYRNEQTPGDMAYILNKFAEYHEVVHGSQFGEENRLDYRYSLVLEVAKHFEEGAKKYGDRNWEKGIPCDRYIDSAVRHYCKWRAGWTDEPHDRAFIWNILCCEWTRQRYGWNLEMVGEDNETAVREFLDKMRNDGEEINNSCVKDTDTGWHFYDIDGKLVAYIFDFKEPEEGKRRQLGRMLHKVWREVTGNPYTIKRIVEERGYICGKDFSICISPSIIAKYNEED